MCSQPEAADSPSSSPPSVPPLCLTLPDHQGAPLRTDAEGSAVETRSTARETTAKAAACSRAQSTRVWMTGQLEVRGRPPAALASTTSSKAPTLDRNQQAPESSSPTRGRTALPEVGPFPNAPPPTVPSAKVSATAPGAAAGNPNDSLPPLGGGLWLFNTSTRNTDVIGAGLSRV